MTSTRTIHPSELPSQTSLDDTDEIVGKRGSNLFRSTIAVLRADIGGIAGNLRVGSFHCEVDNADVNDVELSTGFSLSSLETGIQARFVASGDNTGAMTVNIDGLGAKTVANAAGAAVGAGMAKAGQILSVVYDGTNFVAFPVGGSVSGSTATGEYTRLADGTQICTSNDIDSGNVNTSTGNVFRSSTLSWTYPIAFSAQPNVSGQSVGVAYRWVTPTVVTATAVSFAVISTFSSTAVSQGRLIAIGRWY